MRLAVVGTGYVGLVTGACLADLGNQVVCVDQDDGKIAQLQSGRMPIYEPGLEELVRRNHPGRLRFSSEISGAVKDSQVIFIAVGTPSKNSGEADLSAVEAVALKLGRSLSRGYRVIVNKSTVPVGTARWVREIIQGELKRRGLSYSKFDVVANPEFLRGGSAVRDLLFPDRIVIGSESVRAVEVLRKLYRPIMIKRRVPFVVTDPETAELIKYATNAFLATKISFINEMANICELLGGDVRELAFALGLDRRIGPDFLNAGAGFGGSCIPKDMSALIHMAKDKGYDPQLLKAVLGVNRVQRSKIMEKVEEELGDMKGKTVTLLGLSYKPNTDDVRDAVSLTLIASLMERGAVVKAYDPVASARVLELFPDLICCQDPYQAADGSDALILVTEWEEFARLDLARLKEVMRTPIFIDGRNMLEPGRVREAGFIYRGFGLGRP